MRDDQDWCLECGTAAPGRLGARPGWRAASTVVALTLLLLTGAVAASYAALTGDAQRDASRPSAGEGAPIIAQTPGVAPNTAPVAPGATGPGTTAPPPAKVTPPPAISSQSPGSATNIPNIPNIPQTGAGSTSTGGSSSSTSASNASSGEQNSNSSSTATNTIKLDADAASTYDPAKRAGAEFGPAKNAVDSSSRSVWDVTVPADNAPIGAGLVIDLGALYTLESLKIDTPMQGFDVELYAARGTKIPPDILDARWDHLTDRADYRDGASIALKGRAEGKVRFVNLWFTRARAAEDPRVAVANVTVTGTK